MGLALTISGFLVSVWLVHDCMLAKKGVERYELLLLAAAVLVIAFVSESILLIGLALVLLNAIRLIRQHEACLRDD